MFLKLKNSRQPDRRPTTTGVICGLTICFCTLVFPAYAQTTPTISTPTSSYSNSYTSPQTVTITTSSGSLYYTTDGSEPTNASTAYTAPFTVSSPTQVKAVSYLTGNYSSVAKMYLDVDPTLSPIIQPGLLLRLRADFGVNTSVGSPAPVSTWTDLSGSNNDATGSGSTTPVVITNAINSLPTIRFDGSQFLTLPSGFANFTQTFIQISNAPPFSTSTQRITINGGNNADYVASSSSSTNASIASGLAAAINALAISGVSATSTNDLIIISAPLTTTFTTSPQQHIVMQMQSPGATLFVVTSPITLTASARIIDVGQAGSGNNINLQISSSASKGQFSVYSGTSGTNVQSTGALLQNKFQVLAAAQAAGSSNGTATAYLDGVASSPNSSMNNIPNTTRTSNFIGQNSSTGNFYSGSISEILFYSSKLSSSQIGAISAYLSQKYQSSYQTALTPTFSVAPGILQKPTQISIKTQPGAKTFLTTDNTTPTAASTAYCGEPITINYTQTIKAISILNGSESPVGTATYTLDSSLWPAPNPADTTPPTINLELPTPSI